MFPDMKDTAGTASYTSAHYYMECSNKGICDRTTGQCECYDGYDGTACQRASCPNDCSGHGTCETISELAYDNFENVYALWDKDATMGCACDAGYTAADCSQRHCKVGVDPLYADDTVARYTIVDVSLQTTAVDKLGGTFQLKFYDVWGEDYVTAPINAAGSSGTAYAGANACADVQAALLALPNDVITTAPTCAVTAIGVTKGYSLNLIFAGNPGYLRSLELIGDGLDVLDGSNAATGVATTVSTKVTGENVDYFATQCAGVSAILKDDATWADKAGSHGHLYVATEAERKLLKACLGDSDGDSTNNVEVYNWDYGSMKEHQDITSADDGNGEFSVTTATTLNVIGGYPHAVKVVNPTDSTSELHLLWWDAAALATEEFRIASPNYDRSSSHNVHTTNGVVQQLGFDRSVAHALDNAANQADGELTSNRTEIRIVGYFSQYSNKVYTNIDASCESTNSNLAGLHNCLQKGDKLFIVDGCWGKGETATEHFGGADSSCADATVAATGTGNLYTINKIFTQPWDISTDAVYPAASITGAGAAGGVGYENRFVIEVDQNIPWDGSTKANTGNSVDAKLNSGYIVLFKFTPASDGAGSYTYVSECSNRGACDRESGLCQCFKGYTSDNCSVQSSLAV